MRRLLPVSGRARQSGDTSRLEFPRCVRQEWLLDQAADWPVDDPRFVVIADHLVAMIEADADQWMDGENPDFTMRTTWPRCSTRRSSTPIPLP